MSDRAHKKDDGMMPAEKWAQTAVGKASTYSCGRCGKAFASPQEVYEHLDTEHPKKRKGEIVSIAEQTELAVWNDADLQRLRHLVKTEETSAWEIGDQLTELLPIGDKPGGNRGIAGSIRRIAAEVDAEPRSLTEYRKVAHGWPLGTRVPNATWAAHRAYMGPPASAPARSKTLSGLPRNEHGKITVQAVKSLTKGAGGAGAPGWFELLGRVSDTLTKAGKELDRFETAVGGDDLNKKLRAKASEYAAQAQELATRLENLA